MSCVQMLKYQIRRFVLELFSRISPILSWFQGGISRRNESLRLFYILGSGLRGKSSVKEFDKTEKQNVNIQLYSSSAAINHLTSILVSVCVCVCVCVCVYGGLSFFTVTLCFAEAVPGIWLCTPLSRLKRKKKNHPTENNSCWKASEKEGESWNGSHPEMDDEKSRFCFCFSLFFPLSLFLSLGVGLENMTQLKASTYAPLLFV